MVLKLGGSCFTPHFSCVPLLKLQSEFIQGFTIYQPALTQFERAQFPGVEVLVDVVFTDAELLGRLSG